MKKAEIGPAVLAGRKVLVGEYLGSESRDTTKRPGRINLHKLLVGDAVIEMSDFTAAGEKAVPFLPEGLKSRATVAIEWREWEASKWGIRVRGRVLPLTD